MIKAIIFDFGGPIMSWDDKPIYQKHEDHRGLQRDTIHDVMKQYMMGAVVGNYKDLFEFFEKEKPPIKMTVEELNEVFKEANSTMRVDLKMVEYIKELKQKYKIAILSNFTSGLQMFLKDIFNIYHLFDLVISSYDLKLKKPDYQIYQHTLAQLGVKPDEAVFTDDKEENIIASKELGIHSIIFNNFEQFKPELEKILKNN